MLKIAMLELRLRRRYSKKLLLFTALVIVFTALSGYHLAKNGLKIDSGIYSTNIDVNARTFVRSNDPDVALVDGRFVVKNDLKSYSAYDELRKIVRESYNEWLYQRYGNDAFPILVKIVRVPTEAKLWLNITKKPSLSVPSTTPQTVEKSEREEKGGEKKEKKEETFEVEKVVEEKIGKFEYRSEYTLPENLQPPILLKKFVFSFLIVMPFYFVSQIYMSSLMEDKIRRRFDLLLVATSEKALILGKLLPYLAISLAMSVAISIAMGKSLTPILILPVALFLLSLSTFLVFLARSYKELSFLSVVLTVLVTAYLFLPSVFTVIPMSKISPITLLVLHFNDEQISLSDIAIAVFHLALMSSVLIFLALNSFEYAYAQKNPIEKLIDISIGIVNRYYKVFLASLISIPFVFLIEFFTVCITFPFRNYFVVLLLLLAMVEEFFKGVFTFSAFKNGLNRYASAFLSALGFLIGEKAVLFMFIPIEYAKLMVFPLVAHVLSTTLFVMVMDYGFKKAVTASALLHTLYNGLVICLLSR